MADAGIRLTVEGEKEFKAALAEIDAAVKTNQKSLKLLTEEFKLNETGMKEVSSGFGSMADAAEILNTKGKVLAESIAAQSEKVGMLRDRVDEAAAAYGEHDKRTEALRGQLLDASTALAKMTSEQEKNRQAILDAEHSTKEYDDAVKALEAQLAANQAELKAMGGGLDALKKEYGDLEKESAALEKSGKSLGSGFLTLGKQTGDAAKQDELLQQKEVNLGKQNEALEKQNEKLADSIIKQKQVTEALAQAQQTATERFGKGSQEAEAYRKRLADATGQLDAMERELKENQKAIEDNNKAIEAGGDAPNAMLDGLKQIEEMTGIKIPAGIETMIGGFDGGTLAVGGIVGALGSVALEMKKIYEESMSWSKDLTTKASELDLDTEQYQELEYIALKSGASVGVLENALSKISSKAGEAALKQEELSAKIAEQEEVVRKAKSNKEVWADLWQVDPSYEKQLDKANEDYKEAVAELERMQDELRETSGYFEEMGISIYDSNGNVKDSLTLFYELIDAYAKMENGAVKSAKMQELFGKSYRQLNPYVAEGADLMKQWAQEAHDVGYVMEHGLVATMNNASIEAEVAKKKTESTLKQMTAAFLTSSDVISGAIDAVKIGWQGLNDVLEQFTGKGLLGNLFDFGNSDIGALWNAGKKLFGFASGTNYAPGGLALVGERGPEIVELPRGSKVYPNGTAPELAGGTVYETNTYNVTIDAKNVEEFNDIVRIAQSARVGMRRG